MDFGVRVSLFNKDFNYYIIEKERKKLYFR
jgi:hypothetical protein